MKYGEKCNERKNGIRNERETIYMRICWGKVENFKNIVGGGKCMEDCMNQQLSRTKVCVKTVTGRAWRAWIQVVWGMGRREIWWKCKEYLMSWLKESEMGGCKRQMQYTSEINKSNYFSLMIRSLLKKCRLWVSTIFLRSMNESGIFFNLIKTCYDYSVSSLFFN